jgi:hypothetical protein
MFVPSKPFQLGPTLVGKASGLCYASFTIVIYNHNDHGLHHKTTIMIVSYAPNLALALASVINYDCKWCRNLEHHLLKTLEASFTIVMCL